MPMYLWTDSKSKKEVSVMRKFSEYEVPPTAEEAPDVEDPDWVRDIGGNIAVVKGQGWGSGKGYWSKA